MKKIHNRNNGKPTTYCWSHGTCKHTATDYKRKAEGYQDWATFANMMEGSKNYFRLWWCGTVGSKINTYICFSTVNQNQNKTCNALADTAASAHYIGICPTTTCYDIKYTDDGPTVTVAFSTGRNISHTKLIITSSTMPHLQRPILWPLNLHRATMRRQLYCSLFKK